MKTIALFALLAGLISCKQETKIDTLDEKKASNSIAEISAEMPENAVIYEANIRQYSPEGTFKEFSKDIPVLKELGVEIIWLMPINPISKIKRKATDGRFTSEIEDEEERNKYLGSYYSVSDYRAINPEFGTLEDFKNLVKEAHENGIYVIVDWVPNHTGWDHPWIKNHPEYYTQNEDGEIIDPINPETGKSWGWTDTADLNYDNMSMRNEMIAELKYWLTEANIDGFRMDVAHKVPVDFFEEVTNQLNTIKPVFMLAEAEQPDLLINAFDMHYGWEVHKIFNDIAEGNDSIDAFDAYMSKIDTILEDDDIVMNFITNHDENSWNGTLKERMPNKKEIFTALTYVMPGMPLIYSGQEYDLEYRLKFFEKDSIPKKRGAYFDLLRELGQLKNENVALNAGANSASYKRIESSENVLMFKRAKEGQSILFVGNFSDNSAKISLPEGEYRSFSSNELFKSEDALGLDPWDYKILLK